MGAREIANWIKPTLAVLLVVTFVCGCSSQTIQTASSPEAPSVAAGPGPDAPVTLAAGDALGQRLFVGKTQMAGPAIAKAN